MAGQWGKTRVRELRERLDITQEELARRAGVSVASVWRWEAGRCQPQGAARCRLEEIEAGKGGGA